MKYNPFARNFYRIRRVLIETCDLPRHAVRPSAKLAELIPPEHRARFWADLEREKRNVPPLLWSFGAKALVFTAVSLWTMLGCIAWVTIGDGWPFGLTAIAIIIGIFVVCIVCDRLVPATAIEPSMTVGDLVLAITTPSDCREAGYRLSRNEIFLKVRLIVASSLGVDPAQIKPETNFVEDLGVD